MSEECARIQQAAEQLLDENKNLKSQLKEARETRRIENEGWEEKANHCFKNHISQIVSLETKLERARGALIEIVNHKCDLSMWRCAGGFCEEAIAKKALEEIA